MADEIQEKEYETASDKLDAMMDGSYFENDDTNVDGTTSGSDTDDEDTDQIEAVVDVDNEEIDTNDQIDGDGDDTDGSDVDDNTDDAEENTLVDDDNGAESDADGGDEIGTTGVEDKSKDEALDVDSAAKEETVDYQKQYEELLIKGEANQKFYDRVTSPYQSNGKTVAGFKDPEKIIQSFQKSDGFEDKMSVFKKHKPFLRAIQEQGMVDDTSKFDLAMNIASGDKEAFKQHAKNQGWDLMEMDTDEVAYDAKQQTTSKMEMALDDVMDTASRSGVHDRMESLLSKDWDADSVMRMLDSPDDGNVMVNHMQTGIYDAVQGRIAEKSRTDVSGSYGNKSDYDRYMIASNELETEYQSQVSANSRQNEASRIAEKTRVDAATEADRVETERKDAEYTRSVKEKEDAADAARAKAVRASQPKNKSRKVTKKVDKMKLTGNEFNDYFNKEILGIN